MIRRSLSPVLFCLALALASASATGVAPRHVLAEDHDDEGEEGQVDYVHLAALLIGDGHYDRAEATLRQVDTQAEGIDLVRYHTLSGLVYLHKRLLQEAREQFRRAIRAGQTEPVIYLQLAQAEFGMGEYHGAIKSLERSGEEALSRPSAMQMWAEAYFKRGQHREGFRVLDRAARRFPDNRKIQRMRIFRLVDRGLYQQVVHLGREYLQDADTPEDFLAIGEALRKAGQLEEAKELAEIAQLRFPDSLDAKVLLTHIYLNGGQPVAAAMLMEEAAGIDPKYTVEAAELYRRGGRPTRALLLNARVLDQKKKLKQRLSILLEQGRFEMVAAMVPRLSRHDLLGDENVRYAVAYGYFQIGDFERAEQHLRQLRTAEMFERANQLRKAMQACEEQGWQCT